MTTTPTTTYAYSYTEQSTNTKTKNSNFNETLKSSQTKEASEVSNNTNEKKVDRMSFEFIKSIKMDNISEDINRIYSDLSKEERSKIAFLRHLANASENNTLNKVMFDEAKNMNPQEAMTYSFEKLSEHNHYKHTGTANLSLAIPIMMDKYPRGVPEKEDAKLTHEEAFNMLLNMIEISNEGIQNTKGELQEIHKEYYEEYSKLLEKYNQELRRNIAGQHI